MANVFDKIGDIKNNVHRSTFDWSHANNVTTGIGRVTPIFCEELPPNSSLKIKANLGLQFMPMMYPVQTRMKVATSFYKIPLRTLWKDYMNWISSPNQSSDNLVPPYIGGSDSTYFGEKGLFRVSGLADYLGIPVTAELQGFHGNILSQYVFDNTAFKCSSVEIDGVLGSDALTITNCPSSTSYDTSSSVWNDGEARVDISLIGNVVTKGVCGATFEFIFSGSSAVISKMRDFVSKQSDSTPIFKLCLIQTLTGKVKMYFPVYGRDFSFIVGDTADTHFQASMRFSVPVSYTSGVYTLALTVPNCQIFVNASANSNDTTLLCDKTVNQFDGGVFPLSSETCPYYNTSTN